MFRIEIQAKVLKLGLNLSAESIKRLSLINDFVCNEEHKNPHHATGLILEVCGYSIFATRPVPVAQDRYPYPYPTHTQNYCPTRPVPAGIPVPVRPSLSSVPMHIVYVK